jgi:hypothetical protein
MASIHKLDQKIRQAAEARELANKEQKEARQNAANAMMERNLVLAALVSIQGGPIVIPHDVIQRAKERVNDVRLEAVEVDVVVPRPRAFWQRLKQRFVGGGPVPKVRALQISIEDPQPVQETAAGPVAVEELAPAEPAAPDANEPIAN